MEKKAIFLDIDGTMTGYDGTIPPSAQEALRRAKKNGHQLVICTGRSRFQIYDELLEVGFSGIVGGAGAFVDVNGTEVYHAYIDEMHRKNIYEYMERNGFVYCYQADDGIEANEYSSKRMTDLYRGIGVSEERLEVLFGDMHISETPWKNEKSEKLIYYHGPYSVAKVHEDLLPYFDTVAISFGGLDEYAGEIGINGINKATGMEIYLRHAGIDRKNTIGIGDGPNDLQMIEYAGTGVAMGNAGEEVKQLADLVTAPVGENGLYLAFERLGLI